MNLNVEVIGNGRPFLLLHAFPLNHEMFQAIHLPGYKLILPDFPGFGPKGTIDPNFSLEMASDSLKNGLDEILPPTEKIVLGGVSMGGYWAFEFLRKYPEKVSDLVLISTRPGIDRSEAKQKRLEMAYRVEKEGIAYLPDLLMPGLLGPKTLKERAIVVDRVRNLILSGSPEGVAAAQRAMASRRDQTDLLAKIDCRALILAGADDQLIPITEAKAMAMAIKNSRLEILEQVGHLIPLETANLFEQKLCNFLTPDGQN